MIKKILDYVVLLIMFFVCISTVKADEITSFNFMDKGNNSFIIGANGSTSGDLSIIVENMSFVKPYINLLVATTGYPDFVVSENEYFSNTVIKKLYSSGSTNIDGYTADLYVVQFSTRGTSWNCSLQGSTCYVNTVIRLNNTYPYNAMYQLQSITLTDSVLTDDYLANIQINQNNQIIEQGKETNEKLDNLDDTIQSGNQAIQDSIIESNKETQDVIKDQFNSCRDSYNLLQLQHSPGYTYTGNGVTFIVNDDYSVSVSGTATSTTFLRLQHNIGLPAGTYYFSGGSDGTGTHVQLSTSTNYYANTSSGTKTMIFNDHLTILYVEIRIASGWTGEYTFYPMISKEKTSYEPYGKEICSNKIDDTNDKLDGIQGALTDDSSPDLGALENSAGWLPAGPVDSILNLPLSLLNNLSTTLNKSCNPVILTLPYVNKTITLPCIKDLYDKMGVTGTIFNWAGIIAAAFILYNYLLRLYKWVDDTLTMRENNLPGYFDDNWGGGA